MPVHAILLTRHNDEVVARIQEKYPDCYEMSAGCYLVHDNEITRNVASAVGIKGNDRIEDAAGAVFRLNGAYSGFAARSLWEWLGQAEESE